MKENPEAAHPIDCSIIIPNLHSPIIDQTIESILAQETALSYEIIVVGMDKFNLVKRYPEVRFIETAAPEPPGSARNNGVMVAQGDLLVFIDADCIAKSNWLDAHVNRHASPPHNLVVGGGVTFPNKNYLTLAENISGFHEYMTHHSAGQRTILPSLNLSVSKDVWSNIGGFITAETGEDTDFTYKAKSLGIQLIFEPEAVVTHLPNRHHFNDIIQHNYRYGLHSIKGNPNYWHETKLPPLLRSRFISIFWSPLISLWIILKIVLVEKLPIRYWHTLPIVYFLKIAWCIGFSKQVQVKK